MRVKVATWGNSLAVRLPKETVDRLALKAGQSLEIASEEGRVVLSPIRGHIPTLLEMCAEMRRLGPENEPETVDWGPDVGSEIIDDEWSRVELPPPPFLDEPHRG